MISPIQYILAFFGYVKIPKAVVVLSIMQENTIESIAYMMEIESKDERLTGDKIRILERLLVGQKTLTKFLRSGRLLKVEQQC